MDKAVILARGLGTRMRAQDAVADLDADQDAVANTGIKALMPIDRPFLDYVLDALAEADYRRTPEREPRRAARSDKAKTPRWWEALHPAAGLCIGLGLGLLGARLLSGPAHGPEPDLSASDVRAARLKAVGEAPEDRHSE